MAILNLTSGSIFANGRIVETVFDVKPVPGAHTFADWRPGHAAGARVRLSNGATLEHIQTWCTPYDLCVDLEVAGAYATLLTDGNYFTQYVVRNNLGVPLYCGQLASIVVSSGVVRSTMDIFYGGFALPSGWMIDVYLSPVNATDASVMYRYMTGFTGNRVSFTAANPPTSNPTWPPAGFVPTLHWTSRWRIPAAFMVQLGQAVSLSLDAGVLQDSNGNTTAAVASQAMSTGGTETAFTNFSLVDSSGFSSDAILPPSGNTFYVSSALGLDSRTATQAHSMATPLATPQAALNYINALPRNTWTAVLLRRGDVWTLNAPNQAIFPWSGGQDFAHPFVMGSYWNPADGPDPLVRPRINRTNTAGGNVFSMVAFSNAGPLLNHVVIRGLSLSCVQGVPESTTMVTAVLLTIPGRNITFDDVTMQGFAVTFTTGAAGVSSGRRANLDNLMIHRSMILDAQSPSGAHTGGVNVAAVERLVISQCLVERNGYLSASLIPTDIFSHNSHGYGTTYPELWFETINRLGGSNGTQFRNGGCAAWCLFSRNAVQGFQLGFGGTASTMSVYEKAKDIPTALNVITALAGTTTWTQGSAIVTGSGTAFTTNVVAGLNNGATFIRPAGTLSWYPIQSIQSATQLTLGEPGRPTTPFLGPTATNVAYQKTTIEPNPRGAGVRINGAAGLIPCEGAVYESSIFTDLASLASAPDAVQCTNSARLPVVASICRHLTIVNAGVGIALYTPIRVSGTTLALDHNVIVSGGAPIYTSDAAPPNWDGYTADYNALSGANPRYAGGSVPMATWKANTGGTEAHSLLQAITFVNSSADMGSYYQSIGGTNDEDTFIAMLRARPPRVWLSRHDISNVINYYMNQYRPTNLPASDAGAFGYFGAADYRSGPPPPSPLVSIAVTPVNPSVAKGLTQQFTATGTYADGLTTNLTGTATWTSTTPSVATVAAGGLATSVAAGSTTVRATSSAITGSTGLTVTAAALVSIAVTPVNPSVADGTTQQFTAVGTYTDGTTQVLTGTATWSSTLTGVATIAPGGLATGVTAGSTTIRATSSAITGSTTLTITPATLVSIAVTPANPSVVDGTTQQFVATGTYSDASTQILTGTAAWTSTVPSVATIAAGGLATGVATGSTTIRATVGAVIGSTGLTVTPATLVSIAVTPTNPSTADGLTRQFTATGTYSDASTQDISGTVIWTSTVPSVATIVAGGLATAVAAGSTSIHAVSGAVTGLTTLTVTPAELVSIAVTPTGSSLVAGLSQQFTATGRFTDSTTQDLTGSVTWTSTVPAAATIASSGLATAVAAGSTSIRATSGAIVGSAALTTTAATLSSIAVSPLSATIAGGATQQYAASGTYTDGSIQDLTGSTTWTSSAVFVASIDTSGLATGGTAGSTVIRATSGTVSASATLSVTVATLVSITVTPASEVITAGSTSQFTATGNYSDSTLRDLTSQVAWISISPAVASVSSSGLVTGLTTGLTTIRATLDSIAGSTGLTVSPATLLSLDVTPTNPSNVAGTTRQFAATGSYSDGTTRNITASVIWTSGTLATATIGASTGLATALAAGSTTITAVSGAIAASTTLSVSAAPLVSIAVSPTNPSIVKGTGQSFTATGTYTDGTYQDLTGQVVWTSTPVTVATITSAGAAFGVATGSATIRATLGAITSSTTLTVTPATLLSIAITPANPSLAAGTTRQLRATGTYSDGTTRNITTSVVWTSDTLAAATVTSTGLLSGVAVGTSIIRATKGSVTGSTTATITAATLVSIAVAPANPTIASGTTRQFTATGMFTDSSTQDITTTVVWASGTPAAASITTGGLATGLAVGSSLVSATSGAVVGSTTLSVTAATLLTITVTPGNPSIAVGSTQQFTATGTYSDASNQEVTSQAVWTSGTSTVATIDGNGLATAVGPGNSLVSATIGSVVGFTTLTVSAPVLTTIVVTPADPSVVAGETQQLTAVATFSDGSSLDVTLLVAWTSDAPATVTVVAGGLATALLAGSTVIHAAYLTIDGSTTLTVTPATLVSIAVTTSVATVLTGLTRQFTATGTYSDSSTQDITATVDWTSDTPGVATINSAGLATGVSAGTSLIVAASGLVSDSRALSVIDPPIGIADTIMFGTSDGKVLIYKLVNP